MVDERLERALQAAEKCQTRAGCIGCLLGVGISGSCQKNLAAEVRRALSAMENPAMAKLNIKKAPIEGKPDWAELGVVVEVRDSEEDAWEGPYTLMGYDARTDEYAFYVDQGDGALYWWQYARPKAAWEPKDGDFCAFWDDADEEGHGSFKVGAYKKQTDVHSGYSYRINSGCWWQHCARLGPDVNAACSIADLKKRTDWV